MSQKKMNPKVKALWLEALRSGKYTQGHAQLRYVSAEETPSGRAKSVTRFCCLGVLCNLHAEAHPEIAAGQTYEEYYLGRDNFLPPEVVDWAGLEENDPFIVMQEETETRMANERTLSDMNDSGYTYKRIARWIEKKL